MSELEARIRAFSNNEEKCWCEVAVDDKDTWYPNGCYQAKEAYFVLYLKREGKGRIVEADYKGGPVAFQPKAGVDIDSVPLIDIPASIITTALTPVYPEGIPEKFKTPRNLLRAWHFKPLSHDDWMYIRNNCFRPS